MTLRVNLIGYPEGNRGLASDARVLRYFLERWGCEVADVSFRQSFHKVRPADLNIHLEVDVSHDFHRRAPRNVLIPNPELYWKWRQSKSYNEVWTKTRHGEALLPGSRYIGFTTEDVYRADVERRADRFLHVPGRSRYRSTGILEEAWRRNWRPGLPELVIVRSGNSIPGITYTGEVSRYDLIHGMNAHKYHILPSQTEGFGVALWEARCCGAALVTTNHAPMNEGPAAAYVTCHESGKVGLSTIAEMSAEDVWRAVESVLAMDADALLAARRKAREAWEDLRSSFARNLHMAVFGRPLMQVDFSASMRHYAEHLFPIYRALPPEVRGIFYTTRCATESAARHGIPHEVYNGKADIVTRLREGRGPVVTSASGDQYAVAEAGRPSVFCEHGAGQWYNTMHPSYAGWPGRKGVRLFLVPGPDPAARNRRAYPGVPVVEIGCPKMDYWHSGRAMQRQAMQFRGEKPIVVISFHWEASGVVQEARSAFEHYKGVLGSLAQSDQFELWGHGHPRAIAQFRPVYEALGIKVVEEFEDVLKWADLYVCDNSSTIFEFASTGRPVVVLNAPWYRRQLNMPHGLRFWDAAHVGMQVDEPGDLHEVIRLSLDRSEAYQNELASNREAALRKVYTYRDGRAAERAAGEILKLLRQMEQEPEQPVISSHSIAAGHGGIDRRATGAAPAGITHKIDMTQIEMEALTTFTNRAVQNLTSPGGTSGRVRAGERYMVTGEALARQHEEKKIGRRVNPETAKAPAPTTAKPAGEPLIPHVYTPPVLDKPGVPPVLRPWGEASAETERVLQQVRALEAENARLKAALEGFELRAKEEDRLSHEETGARQGKREQEPIATPVQEQAESRTLEHAPAAKKKRGRPKKT